MLAISDSQMKIYDGQNMLQSISAPWSADGLNNLQYAQRFDTMIFVHQDFQPRVLKKLVAHFICSTFDFSTNDDMSRNMPFMKFDDAVV